jgi:hypothetical protein
MSAHADLSSAFFDEQGTTLVPRNPAASNWGTDSMRGPAITGALARAAEQLEVEPGLRPARVSFELFRAARMVPSTTRAEVVRHGRRLTLVDTFMLQDDVVVARAHVLLLAESANPIGRIWETDEKPEPPAEELPHDSEGRLYRSGGDWTAVAADHDNDGPKDVWQRHLAVVQGEIPSAFVSTAVTTDLTSLVVHWGDQGVQFINADASVALSRLPVGDGIGIAISQRTADDGISVGSGTLFDVHGPFGTASVAALANARRAVTVGAPLRNQVPGA